MSHKGLVTEYIQNSYNDILKSLKNSVQKIKTYTLPKKRAHKMMFNVISYQGTTKLQDFNFEWKKLQDKV